MPRTTTTRGRQSATNGPSTSSQCAEEPAASQAAAPSFSQSQAQQSQAEKVIATMSSAEIDKKVQELVQYLLVMDQRKIPIKKMDINKMILKDASKALPEILKRASEQLTGVFGIKVVELQDKLKGSYILVKTLPKESEMTWSAQDNAKTGLLTAILSIIFMSGNVIQDNELWHSLKPLGIDPDLQHETFGDVKKLVTGDFVRQAYLEFTKLPDCEQPVFEVRWGQRARLETSKMHVLKFVSLMYNKEPDQWTAQYQDAKE